jgi:hypothetical protein
MNNMRITLFELDINEKTSWFTFLHFEVYFNWYRSFYILDIEWNKGIDYLEFFGITIINRNSVSV